MTRRMASLSWMKFNCDKGRQEREGRDQQGERARERKFCENAKKKQSQSL